MRICLYTGSALPKLGGQEAVVDALAREFLRLGHEPIVLAPRPRLPLRPADSLLPYPVIRHPRFFSTKRFVGFYRRFLMAAHRQHRFDVVHCHDVYPTGYVASLCRLDVPLVMTSHGGDVRAGNVRLEKPGMRPRFLRAVGAADALVSIGQFTRDGFLQLQADPARIHDIPNGVDLKPFERSVARPAELDASIIPGKFMLFLGRLAHRKGIDVLLRALSSYPETGGIELVIGGSGDEQANVQRLIVELGLQSRVVLAGRVTGDVKTYLLQNAKWVVVPSRGWEAFPLVVLEAYAAGRPVIGSRIAGLKDVVEPGVTGALFEENNAGQLALAFRSMDSDPELLKSTGIAAKARAADFGWETIANRHLELYETLREH
jgi:glycosyltransferase involved in cell wall biosynthesis